MAEQLRRCPFCWGAATIEDNGVSSRFRWFVACQGDCGASQPATKLKALAVTKWNTRMERKPAKRRIP